MQEANPNYDMTNNRALMSALLEKDADGRAHDARADQDNVGFSVHARLHQISGRYRWILSLFLARLAGPKGHLRAGLQHDIGPPPR